MPLYQDREKNERSYQDDEKPRKDSYRPFHDLPGLGEDKLTGMEGGRVLPITPYDQWDEM